MELIVTKQWNGEENAASNARAVFDLDFTASGIELNITMSSEFRRVGSKSGHGRVEELWTFDVAEIFFASDDGTYTEFEIDRLGNHLLYTFSAPRERVSEGHDFHPDIVTEELPSGVCHRLLIPSRFLPADIDRMNAFAIIDNEQFLAAHTIPGKEPDFHQPSTFPAI
jgi:hypothetical protein